MPQKPQKSSQVNILVPAEELNRWKDLRAKTGLSFRDLIVLAMRGVSVTVRQDPTP